MRIISGSLRGRVLHPPEVAGFRPTMDQVRGALFSSLGSAVEGARFLDLYAGSGAVGLEAISRGAERAVFIEGNRTLAAALRRTITDFRTEERTTVLDGTLPSALKSCPTGPYQIVFADPPYGELSLELPKELVVHNLVSSGSLFVVETDAASPQFEWLFPSNPPLFPVLKRAKGYGDSELRYFEFVEPA